MQAKPSEGGARWGMMLMYLGGHSKIGNDRKFPHFLGGGGGSTKLNTFFHPHTSMHNPLN